MRPSPRVMAWAQNALDRAVTENGKNRTLRCAMPLRVSALTRTYLVLPKRAPERQVIGDLEQAADHQWRRQPAGGKQCTADGRAGCGREAPGNGGEARCRSPLGRRDHSHD